VAFKVEVSIKKFWVKENERTIAFVQSYGMRNLFSNPVYVDEILLVRSDVNPLHEKKLLSSRFNKKVLGEISLVIRIEIHRDRRKGVLGLSHRHAKKSF
jgi:hypothetical protein